MLNTNAHPQEITYLYYFQSREAYAPVEFEKNTLVETVSLFNQAMVGGGNESRKLPGTRKYMAKQTEAYL